MNAIRLVALIVLFVGLMLIESGNGHAFRRKSSATGPRGRTVTNEATTTRTPGGYSRSATTTGPGGASVNRTSQGQWNPATKTWTNTTTSTGPQGQSGTVTRSTTVAP